MLCEDRILLEQFSDDARSRFYVRPVRSIFKVQTLTNGRR